MISSCDLCDSIDYEIAPPSLSIELIDANSSDNIFTNGTFNMEDLQIFNDEDQKVSQRTVYTYNDKQQIASKTSFEAKDEFLQKVVFEYDNNGNVERETRLNRKDKPVRQVVFSYNKEKRVLKYISTIGYTSCMPLSLISLEPCPQEQPE